MHLLLRRLLRVGNVADSMGAYVPAMVLQKALGLGRVLLFAYLMVHFEMGLWALGMMIFTIASPIMTFGSNNGLARYVSYYEARGRLKAFYRVACRGVFICAVVMLAVGLLTSPVIARLLVAYRLPETPAGAARLLGICTAAMANAFVLALHSNMIGFMVGMRAYRLASAVEVFFTVTFTIFSIVALLLAPTGMAVLLAHLVAMTAALLVGTALLHAGIVRLQPQEHQPSRAQPRTTLVVEPHVDPEEITYSTENPALMQPAEATEEPRRVFWRMIRFGLVAMIGNFMWLAAQYVSFYVTYQRRGEAAAGVFSVFLQLSQLTLFLANAAWAVIFTHVAKYWEIGQKHLSVFVLETAYKAIAMVIMTLTVVVYILAPLWVPILPASYRHGILTLGGLLAFFQTITHLAVMTILAKLRERPFVIAIAALVGGALNVALAVRWTGSGQADPQAAAWAAGFGMYIGAGAVTVVYLLSARVKLMASTWFIMAAPGLLLATKWVPVWACTAIWAAICAAAILTTRLFSDREKHLLLASLQRILVIARRMLGKC